MQKTDIYFEGRIYQGCTKEMPRRIDFELSGEYQRCCDRWKEYLATIPLSQVIKVEGSHPFTEGQNVTGLYEVRYQGLTRTMDKWIDCPENIYNELDDYKRRIIAIPLQNNLKDIIDEAKKDIDDAIKICMPKEKPFEKVVGKIFDDNARIDEIIKLVDAYWKFDNNQRHCHNWHDKQDLLDLLRNFKT